MNTTNRGVYSFGTITQHTTTDSNHAFILYNEVTKERWNIYQFRSTMPYESAGGFGFETNGTRLPFMITAKGKTVISDGWPYPYMAYYYHNLSAHLTIGGILSAQTEEMLAFYKYLSPTYAGGFGTSSLYQYYYNAGNWGLQIGPSNNGSKHVTINNYNGNVGIGTTSPLDKLHLSDGALRISGNRSDGLSLNVSNVLFVNGSSGNVGIGTTTPNTILDVSGKIRINTTDGCQGTCSKGTIAWNESNNKFCVCVATNTWYYSNLSS